jgi:hypothetical protein
MPLIVSNFKNKKINLEVPNMDDKYLDMVSIPLEPCPVSGCASTRLYRNVYTHIYSQHPEYAKEKFPEAYVLYVKRKETYEKAKEILIKTENFSSDTSCFCPVCGRDLEPDFLAIGSHEEISYCPHCGCPTGLLEPCQFYMKEENKCPQQQDHEEVGEQLSLDLIG